MTAIIAVSGSPVRLGNVETAMLDILHASGEDWEFIRLTSMNIGPCKGCLSCAASNRCRESDDMNDILARILTADALLVGAFPTFFSLNALTKTFVERLFPLKHNHLLTKGKLGVSVAGGFRDGEVVEDYLRSFFLWFGMQYVGCCRAPGCPPCRYCGYGRTCAYSNLSLEAESTLREIRRYKEDTHSRETARDLGNRLAGAIRKMRSSVPLQSGGVTSDREKSE